MKPALLASLGMLVALSGWASWAHAHEEDRHGDARQRSAHHRVERVQQPASAGGMLAVPTTAAPGEPGHAWRYFSDLTAGTAVVISPHGEYFFNGGDGLRLVAVTRATP